MLMLKRTLAGILGALSIIAGSVILYGTARDVAAPSWLGLVMGFIGVNAGISMLIIAVRYIRFAYSGTLSWVPLAKLYLLGVGCFFPAFVFSIPFTMLWANHTWPGDGQSSFAGGAVSLCIGVIASVVCWVVSLIRRLGHEPKGTI